MDASPRQFSLVSDQPSSKRFSVDLETVRNSSDCLWESAASSPGVAPFLSAVPIELWDRWARCPWSCRIVLFPFSPALPPFFSLLQRRLGTRQEKVVVYHLVEKTGWSKLAVNGTYQNLEWKFPWDVHVPFPRTSSPGRIQAEKSRTSRKSKWNANFPFGYSGWEFWTTSEDVPFISEISRSGKPKIAFPFQDSNGNFRIFFVNDKHSVTVNSCSEKVAAFTGG